MNFPHMPTCRHVFFEFQVLYIELGLFFHV